MLSVIIPIYNEEKILSENKTFFNELSKHAELVFVDGGSVDGSTALAARYGKVLKSEKGRALQMNCGARSAQGESLLFLHADSIISFEAFPVIKENLRNYVGGCFTQRIDKKGSIFRFIESFGNARAQLLKVFYGDQGIFVKKDIFNKIGGFPQTPIMEDTLFSKKLRRLGKTVVLPDKICVSARRWEKEGVLKTAALYSFLNILFWFKVPREKVKSFYRDSR